MEADTYFILLPQEAEDAWHLVSDVERCSLTAVAGLAALGPKKMQSKAWKKGCCGVRLGVQDVDTYCQRRLPIPKQVLSRGSADQCLQEELTHAGFVQVAVQAENLPSRKLSELPLPESGRRLRLESCVHRLVVTSSQSSDHM